MRESPCRSRQDLFNDAWTAKISFDTAENEPSEVLRYPIPVPELESSFETQAPAIKDASNDGGVGFFIALALRLEVQALLPLRDPKKAAGGA